MLNWRKDKSDENSSDGAEGATTPPASAPQSKAPEGSMQSQPRVQVGRLGEMLVKEGVVTSGQLEEALEQQRGNGKFLGQVLVEMNFITQATLVSFLVKQCKIPHISLVDYVVSDDLFKLVPKELCLKHNLLPIDKLGRILTLAMVDPLDVEALEQVRKTCPDIKIKPILCDWNHFDSVARKVFHTEVREAQEVTAGSFGLPEQKSRPKPKEPDKQEQAAVDAAVDALVKGAAASARPEAKAPLKANTGSKSDVAPRATKSGVTSAPAASVETAASQVTNDMRALLNEALAPLLAAGPRASAPALDPQALQSTIRDSLQEIIAPLLVEQEKRLAEMTEMMVKTTQATEATLKAIQEERAPAPGATASSARIANLEIFPGTSDISAGELSEAGVLDSPGLGMEADERVREAVDSDRILNGYTFEEFLVGPANTFTLKAARALGEQLALDFNPLYVCGDEGLGKTHLLNAVGNALLARNPDLRVAYVSTSHFAGAFGTALKHDELSEFRDRFCRWDVLLIDDIQFLAGRTEAQEELFHIFNALVHEGRVVVIAGDRSPDKLSGFQKGLASRFSSGIVTKLRPPEMDVRLAILNRYAEMHRVVVPEEILSLVATRIATDVRKMRGALRKVIAYAKLVEQDITREMANEVLDSLGAEDAA